MEVISGTWKSCIIFELSDGAKCPSKLHKLFPEANARVINQQLKKLEMYGIIEKLEEWGNFFRPNMEKILGMSADKM